MVKNVGNVFVLVVFGGFCLLASYLSSSPWAGYQWAKLCEEYCDRADRNLKRSN